MIDESQEEFKKPYLNNLKPLRPTTAVFISEKIDSDHLKGKQMGKRACFGESRTNNLMPSSHLR